MLEWRVRCPKCGAYFGGVALPPSSWLTRLFGAKCWKCGTHYTPAELLELEHP